MAGKYSRCKDDGTDKQYAINAIVNISDAIIFWFPSATKPGCYSFKPEYMVDDCTPDEEPNFLPTLMYGQAEDLATLSYHWANDHYACVGSKKELDHWIAEARRKAWKEQ